MRNTDLNLRVHTATWYTLRYYKYFYTNSTIACPSSAGSLSATSYFGDGSKINKSESI